jgi:hypothetical protein
MLWWIVFSPRWKHIIGKFAQQLKGAQHRGRLLFQDNLITSPENLDFLFSTPFRHLDHLTVARLKDPCNRHVCFLY